MNKESSKEISHGNGLLQGEIIELITNAIRSKVCNEETLSGTNLITSSIIDLITLGQNSRTVELLKRLFSEYSEQEGSQYLLELITHPDAVYSAVKLCNLAIEQQSTGRELIETEEITNQETLMLSDQLLGILFRKVVSEGRISEVNLLLCNLDKEVIYSLDSEGHSALHWAAGNGLMEILRILITYADPDHTDLQDKHGNTALHQAIIRGQNEVAKFLLTKMSKRAISAYNCSGQLALKESLNSDEQELIELLIRKTYIGAIKKLLDSLGKELIDKIGNITINLISREFCKSEGFNSNTTKPEYYSEYNSMFQLYKRLITIDSFNFSNAEINKFLIENYSWINCICKKISPEGNEDINIPPSCIQHIFSFAALQEQLLTYSHIEENSHIIGEDLDTSEI